MTTPSPDSQSPLVTPTPEEAAAISDARNDEEIRALAQQVLKASELGFEPTTIVKGIVAAIDLTSSPPTISLQISGDTATTISSVRVMNNYTPVTGQTVLIAKQGADIVVLGQIADANGYEVDNSSGGWNKATLAAGSHGGNDNGDVYYRRILDHGSWKMQWRGGWDPSGATVMVSALAAEFRPTSKRTVLAARQIQTGAVSVQFDFNTNGSVTLVGDTATAASAVVSGEISWVDPVDTTTSTSGGTSTVDPGDTTTSTSGGTSTVDPVDTTTTVSLSSTGSTNPGSTGFSDPGGTTSVDPNDNTITALDGGYTDSHGWDLSHWHGVTGSHSHGAAFTHQHSSPGSHSHSIADHSHGVTGSHSHAVDSHSHGVTGSHSHAVDSHSHGVTGGHDHDFTGGSHAHAVTTPTWVSLNNVEYYL
jgi:hypothetical protein